MANRAGCVKPVSFSGASSSPQMMSASPAPSSSSSRSRTRSSASANTGKRAWSSRPMPRRWAPCPENRKALRVRPRACPSWASGAGSPASQEVSASRPAVPSASVTTASRCSRAARVVASEYAVSSAPGAPGVSRWARRAAACSRRAAAERAESIQGRTPAVRGSARASSGWAAGVSGACSTMTCALVPLTPKEETPERRGRSGAVGQGRFSVSSSTLPAVQSTWVEGRSTCRVFGSTPLRIAMTIFMIPATPDAAWVWPMFDLIEPSSRGCSRFWP